MTETFIGGDFASESLGVAFVRPPALWCCDLISISVSSVICYDCRFETTVTLRSTARPGTTGGPEARGSAEAADRIQSWIHL